MVLFASFDIIIIVVKKKKFWDACPKAVSFLGLFTGFLEMDNSEFLTGHKQNKDSLSVIGSLLIISYFR